nr:hypothetical protein [uncultured Pseudodesulfovibrio sp.]
MAAAPFQEPLSFFSGLFLESSEKYGLNDLPDMRLREGDAG